MATATGGGAEPTATVTIDPRGNLLLIAGEAKHPILVSSPVLQLASEVFRAMLGPKFKEGKRAQGARQVCPELRNNHTFCKLTSCS